MIRILTVEQAKEMFTDLKLNIVTSYIFFGGFIGNKEHVNSWLTQQVNMWVKSVQTLGWVAQHEPQASFVALTKS